MLCCAAQHMHHSKFHRLHGLCVRYADNARAFAAATSPAAAALDLFRTLAPARPAHT
jgi:hypothetical protein